MQEEVEQSQKPWIEVNKRLENFHWSDMVIGDNHGLIIDSEVTRLRHINVCVTLLQFFIE